MLLCLMRHGEAEDPDRAANDFSRELTDLGRTQVGNFAQWLTTRQAPPDLILHSPLVRARQTAEVFAAHATTNIPLTEVEWMSPGASASTILRRAADFGLESVLCVGHQPDIGRCIGELIGGGAFKVPPGCCAGIRIGPHDRVGDGALKFLCTSDWFGG